MREVPAEVVRSWPQPNYVNPETKAPSIIVAASICIPIIVMVFAARMYSRIYVAEFFGLDDWLIIPAAISGLGYSSVMLSGIRRGWYKHIWNVRPATLIEARKLVIAADFCGLLNVGFTKLSVLALYVRLTPPSRFQTTVFVLMGLTIAWMISMSITNFLMCIPLHAYWEIGYKGKQTCFVEVPYFVAFSSVDLVFDTVIYLLPLPILFRLRMPRRQKLILLAVFGIGILAIASAALRLPSLFRVSESYDLSWEIYDSVIWTETEATVGIFCASVPALKPLLLRYAPQALDSDISGGHSQRRESHFSLAARPPGQEFSSNKPVFGSNVELVDHGYGQLSAKDEEAQRPYS